MTSRESLIVFRADASLAIGTGHIARCLALADAVRALGGATLFVTRDLGVGSAESIAGRGHEAITLPAPSKPYEQTADAPAHAGWAGVGQVEDAAQTLAALSDCAPGAMVVDSYAFDARWHTQVAASLAVPIAAIDDLGDRPLRADIIVDHNVHDDHRAKYRHALGRGTRLLAGPRFALISQAYAQARPYRFSDRVRSIGIFMGGVDQAGWTPRIVDALRNDAGFAGRIAIAATSQNPRAAALAERAAQGQFDLLCDLPSLSAFFSAHDLQIGAAGGATWERCCMGAPTLAIAVADNQREVLDPLSGLGALATIPSLDPSPGDIAKAVRTLIDSPETRRALSARARALVDGRGAERVAMTILADRLDVRVAQRTDADPMLSWRNDPSVRESSRQRNPISREDHLAWLARVIGDPDRHLLVGEIGGRAVGVVRYDLIAPGEYEISIYLDPDCLGLGLGPRLLAAGEAWLGARANAPAAIIAEFHPENLRSRAMFEKAGFVGPGNRVRKALPGAGERAEQ